MTKARCAMMACFARGGSLGVATGLAERIHTVMASGAARYDSGMVHNCSGERRCAVVAGLARSGGWEVRRWLTERRCAVMASCAARRDPSMIEGRAKEARGALVASLARGRGRDVRRWLTERRRAVMASCAARRDPSMIERRAEEAGGALVAGLARGRGRDVRRWLTERRRAVVAGGTRTGYLFVVNVYVAKCRHDMACVASVACRRMTEGPTDSNAIIVAGGASLGCPLKCPANMTGGAVHASMSTSERKCRSTMIEAASCSKCCTGSAAYAESGGECCYYVAKSSDQDESSLSNAAILSGASSRQTFGKNSCFTIGPILRGPILRYSSVFRVSLTKHCLPCFLICP